MSEPKRRLRACVENWPDAETGEYNPACCRFPKSCSATVYDPERVTEADLEPITPEPKRKWGDAPGRIVFGGDDDRVMWTWECRIRFAMHHAPDFIHFGDEDTHADALEAIAAHMRHHERIDEHDAAHRYGRAVHAPSNDECPAWCRNPEHERSQP
jgi:hypothetical protein